MTDPAAADRIRGAVWGQLVGDAACLGAHWIYDRKEIARLWPAGVQGFEAPSDEAWVHSAERANVPLRAIQTKHYHSGKRSGDQTHYGHAALLLLASVAERGRFDELDFGRRFVDTFADPGYRGYADQAMRGMLANYAELGAAHPAQPLDFQHGADDFEPGTISRLASVVVAHRDDHSFLSVIERATRLEHNNPYAIAYAQCHSLILRAVLRGAPLRVAFAEAEAELPLGSTVSAEQRDEIGRRLERLSADLLKPGESVGEICRVDHSFPVGWPATVLTRPPLAGPMCRHSICSTQAEVVFPQPADVREDVRNDLRGALARAGEDVVTATEALGKGCRLDWSFPSAMQAALRHEDDFRAAIVGTARAGGDSAGRSSMIGALLGASLGVAGIPAEWRERLSARAEIERHVERLVAAAPQA